MIVTKRSLARRTVLRGLGAALGLPFLDAMFPAFSAVVKTAAKPVHRFHAIYVPNGMAMKYWTPEAEGRTFELTPILQPFAPFRNQMLVLTGLRASWSRSHAGASTSFLTGTPRGGRTETEILASISMDQVLAKEFGKSTQLASLELALDTASNAGECTSGLSCAYTHTISWRTPTLPLPMESNPRSVFERLFGDSGSTDPTARLARMRQSKSMLDSVMEQLATLKRELGPQDQVKVNDFTEAVRDVERRIEKTEEQSEIELPLLEQPQGTPASFEEHMRLMLDLQLLAFQSDLTRVITFMIGREQNSNVYPQIGVNQPHHPLSHHSDRPDQVALMAKVNGYHAKLVSEYLAKVRATADGDGSLLDHMTIMYGAGISNSTRHAPDNLPILLLGGGAGRLQGGRHLTYPGETPMANLLVTLLDKLDIPVERLGASNGQLRIDTRAVETLAGF